jgi:prepilin-type N-terminal cleavage/methylation domain-containing protein/prepilin-type processing-associated H-X9-DG protein
MGAGRCDRSNTARPRAFTLVELLVVIAIIAILAALLLPMYARVKASALQTRCQAQHRQFIEGILLYIQDYNNWLPHKGFLTWKSGQHLYHKYFKNDDLPICIPRKQAYGSIEMLLSIPSTEHYVPNHCPSCKMHVHYAKNVLGTGYGIGRPFTTIIYPRRTPAFLCSVSLGAGPDGKYRGYGWGADDGVDPVRQLNIHNGGTNYSFLDGHVRWYLPQGGGFQVHIEGFDYDGDGSIGTANLMQ